jgi:hypothetical protein
MKTLSQLEKQLQDLRIAFAQKLLTTNEYCETYLAISKKIQSFDTEALDYVYNMNEAQIEDRLLGNI